MASEARTIVVQATTELFGKKDVSAVERYFGPTYIQHNPSVADGIEGLRALADSLAASPDFKATPHRVIADGPLVVLHSTYEGFGPVPLVAFDLFRVADVRIVEHWDALAPVTPPNPSGRTQIDGQASIVEQDKTEATRALVKDFVTRILINAEYDKLPQFIDGEKYLQHNSNIADGLSGLSAAIEALGKQGIKMEYFKLHRVIAEGNFALAQSEGAFGGTPTAYYDLFRIEGGRIVEHWDVMQPIPPTSEAKNQNGMF
jgi:predicted SnoaL-like aldol condensation-catalyzing enzyme